MGLNMPGVAQKISYLVFNLFSSLGFCDDVFFPLDDEFVGVVCGALLLACSSELLIATDLKCTKRWYLYNLDSLEILKVICFKESLLVGGGFLLVGRF